MAEFKTINTQEEFDAAIKDRLERERAKYADYDELRKRANESDGYKSKLEAANNEIGRLKADANAVAGKLANHDKEIGELTERAAKAERSLLCRRIAEEQHLPSTLADRLMGNTEDDLRKDAKALAQFVQIKTAPLASVEKPVSSGTETHVAAINEAYIGLLSSLKEG